jgi:adenylate cyclase
VLSPQELAQIRERNPNAPTAVMVVPMVVSERVIGALGVENISNARAFTDHDGALLSALGDYAAIAIENARNFQQLEEIKEREKMAIRGAFERYVAPSVVDRVLRSSDEMRLGGHRRNISVLFADIRGYTSYAEQADPEEVVDLLNQYFTLATDIILAREGTLDKFLGDAVMAFFNAPEDQEDHPYRVVDAALALQASISEFNARRGGEGLNFSIGINMGEAVVGNVGTPRAMNYTAIGDVVNVAKRLQERAEPGQILVEESVVKCLGDLVIADKLGEMQMKGRRVPAVVYTLKGLA